MKVSSTLLLGILAIAAVSVFSACSDDVFGKARSTAKRPNASEHRSVKVPDRRVPRSENSLVKALARGELSSEDQGALRLQIAEKSLIALLDTPTPVLSDIGDVRNGLRSAQTIGRGTEGISNLLENTLRYLRGVRSDAQPEDYLRVIGIVLTELRSVLAGTRAQTGLWLSHVRETLGPNLERQRRKLVDARRKSRGIDVHDELDPLVARVRMQEDGLRELGNLLDRQIEKLEVMISRIDGAIDDYAKDRVYVPGTWDECDILRKSIVARIDRAIVGQPVIHTHRRPSSELVKVPRPKIGSKRAAAIAIKEANGAASEEEKQALRDYLTTRR